MWIVSQSDDAEFYFIYRWLSRTLGENGDVSLFV
jgi:hypothetical protein